MNSTYIAPKKGWLTMFDTIDERAEQNDPHSWKDWAFRAGIAVVIVSGLAGVLYMSVSGS